MRSPHQRSATGAAVLMLIGASHLAAGRGYLGIGDSACAPQLPLIAPLGIHLDLLVESELCPEHSYLPGVNFGRLTQSFMVLSATALLAGLVMLLLALGAGYYTRRVVRSAREWLRTRIAIVAPGPGLPHLPQAVATGVLVIASGRRPYQPLQRRGPPALFS